MKKLTTHESLRTVKRTSRTRQNLSVLFLLLLTFVFIPNKMNADIVSVNGTNIYVFSETTWLPISTMPLTLNGYTITDGLTVTWNSDNLLFYAVVNTTAGSYRLVTVEPSTGICIDKGNIGAPFGSLTYSGAANSLPGTLYGFGYNDNKLYSVNVNNGATAFLGGPYAGADGISGHGIIVYNYTDNFIYFFTGFFSPTEMFRINNTTFIAEYITSNGFMLNPTGAVYKGGGNFIVTRGFSPSSYNVTTSGTTTLLSGLPFIIRGFGYIDPLLPVELTSFTSLINGRSVELNWTTAAETNNSGFDIERSIVNGQWSKVGNVTGNGTSTIGRSYSFTDRNLASGNYKYRLKQIDFNGNFEYFNLNNEVNVGIPVKFELSQNYPNPFNPATKIEYQLPNDGNVSISVFDNAGKKVASLVNEFKTAGYYTVNFNAASLSSGVYFYKINSGSFNSVKKMTLIK